MAALADVRERLRHLLACFLAAADQLEQARTAWQLHFTFGSTSKPQNSP